MGHVIQQVVSSFEPGAVRGVGAARSHVRHRVNMGNGKLGDCVKIDRQRSDPRANSSGTGGRSDMRSNLLDSGWTDLGYCR